MKKILLSLSLLLGIGASAQLSFNGDFEDGTFGGTYGQFGGGFRTPLAMCTGTQGGEIVLSSSLPQSGWMIQGAGLVGQTNNGQALSVSASYNKGAGVAGSVTLAYFVKDAVTGQWNIGYVGTPVILPAAAITSCANLTATIPVGALQPGAEVGVGIWFSRSSGTGSMYVDDINFVQNAVAAEPGCTTFTTPIANSTIGAGSVLFSWPTVPTAVNYKVKVGTTSGGSDIFNGVVAGGSKSIPVPKSATLFASVTPSNSIGDATGCAEITFSTTDTIIYCGPLGTNQPGAGYPISSVSFAGQGPNTSTAAVGSVPYQDFTSVVFNAISGATYPLELVGTGVGANRFGMVVYIDWNENGSFNDAGEQYFNTPATFKGGAGEPVTLTGNIAIPDGVTPGSKRMRIKYNFSSSTTSLHVALATACSDMSNGQAEDYTIAVTSPVTATAAVTKNAVSVYPNPFHDVLKISDVKGIKSISVSDVSGRQVKNMKPASELNLSDLKTGMYIVTFNMEDGTVKSFKTIKK